MAIQDDASLAMIPAAYGAAKLYSVIPSNGNGDFTHSRTGNATRVNKGGFIEIMGSNVPRLDYPLIDGVVQDCPALLLEPSRTNYLLYSEDLSQSNWVKSNTGTGVAPTVTANYAISPDGSQNASRVQFDINGGTTISDRSRLYQDAGTGTSGNQAYSVYVKSNDSSSHAIVFRALGGTFNVKTVTTEWQRIDMIATDDSFYFELGLYGDSATADTADILVWGAQMEEGSYPTSYIPTSGSTVTRNADECNGAGTSAEFNDSEGVLFAEIAALANDGTYRAVAISDGTLDNRVSFYFRVESNRINFRVRTDISGTPTDSFNNTYDVSNLLEFNKIALKYKQNDFAVWVNGIEVLTDTNGNVFSSGTLNKLSFDRADGGDDFYGKVKQLMTFKTALSDSDLEDLTSWDSFSEMAKGQLYTIE